jgi:sugar-specific transcriptional regulator TrmB
MSIEAHLAALGLGEKKARVYLTLLHLGNASASEIARRSGVKRPTVYDLMSDLMHKKLVTETFSGRKRRFTAEDPANLAELPRQQAAVIERLMPELQSLYSRSPRKPKIRFYEGAEGVRRANEELLRSREKQYFYFGSVREMVEITGQAYLEDFVKRRVAAGITSHAIRVKNKEVSATCMKGSAGNKRNLRFFTQDIPGDIVGLYVFDNKVVISSALKESYGMVVESRELATLMKALWRMLWEVSTES